MQKKNENQLTEEKKERKERRRSREAGWMEKKLDVGCKIDVGEGRGSWMDPGNLKKEAGCRMQDRRRGEAGHKKRKE